MNEHTLSQASRTQGGAFLRRHGLRRRWGALALLLVIIGGAAWNWNGILALGIAPLILAILPCLAMCALGLCMHKLTGKTCTAGQQTTNSTETQTEEASLLSASTVEPSTKKPRCGQ